MQHESAIAIDGAADDLPLSGIRVIDLCIILAGPNLRQDACGVRRGGHQG